MQEGINAAQDTYRFRDSPPALCMIPNIGRNRVQSGSRIWKCGVDGVGGKVNGSHTAVPIEQHSRAFTANAAGRACYYGSVDAHVVDPFISTTICSFSSRLRILP
jgi:hypothetical protein